MDRRRDGFVDNFIVDTTFETHSKSCYIVAAFTMRGKRACLKGQTLIQNTPSVSEDYLSASLEKALSCGLSWISSFSMNCANF